MNEKVKLTKEQAEAIEYLKKLLSDTSERKRNLQLIKEKLDHDYHWESPNFKAANEIPDDIFIAALHYGYEVEPEFKVGDWVTNTSNGYIKLIENEREANFLNNDYIKYHELRHATPEEIEKEKDRRWWAKHGREVWVLKAGDVLLNRDNELCEVTGKSDLNVFINDKPQQGSTIGSYGFKVICFVEDRKDI